MAIHIKNFKEVELMRVAGKKAAETLLGVGELISPGITGIDIDRFVKEDTEKKGGKCAPYLYTSKGTHPPFPGHCCISYNELICHGIPNNKPLDNCVFNIDITTIYNGAYGDTSAMFYLGNISDESKRLLKTTRECLDLAIQEVKNNIRVGTIGAIIQEHAEKNGYSIVRDFCGHGLGIGEPNGFHMPPNIPHFGTRGAGIRLPTGLTFTIEPMLNMGTSEIVMDETNGWEARTLDGLFSAQWEHSILVLSNGCEILTQRDGVLKNSVE